ncbi:hypothetical protein L0668_00065 [Paraglaciecola aquimarina]|uniref:FlgO domain-containing protein n=1 Tax=Paraglaciecola algarum TaxID=3050085 RepID=A0ABS9D3U2_9ALTE|nr:FlgO family outer membrane protein [Paraglaciecola sp. G1-23]MCF2946494.1 hypothetical protein [Paraglaciecola sp. G1-23]
MKSSLLKIVSPPLLLLTLSNCSSNLFSVSIEDKNVCISNSGESIQCESVSQSESHKNAYTPPEEPAADALTDPSLFRTGLHFNLLNDYVEQMALDIRQDLSETRLAFPIAVASFVHLDSSLTNTNVLGNQIAEHFITELRDMGLAVSDHKITGRLQVTPRGDFAFSRDVEKLKNSQNVGYVLTGTMTKQMNGTLINARVVGLTSNMVVASSSKLIPNVVL